MNKTILLVIGLVSIIFVLIVCVIVAIFAIPRFKSTSSKIDTESVVSPKQKQPKANSEDIEKRITWNQTQLNVSTFSTREDPVGQVLEDKMMAHIAFKSFFSLTSMFPMKSMSLNVTEFKQGVGTPVIINPPHTENSLSYTYYYTDYNLKPSSMYIINGENPFNFAVTGSLVKNLDEISSGGGVPEFTLISKNLGTVSTQQILDRDKIYMGEKTLEYLGITSDQLDGNIALEFHIVFDDGKEYNKSFSGKIEGDKILNSPFYQIDMK